MVSLTVDGTSGDEQLVNIRGDLDKQFAIGKM